MRVSTSYRKHSWHRILAMLVMSLCFTTSFAAPAPEQTEVSEIGAQVFVDRCVLCHGNYGAGDGFIPLLIKGYPNTSLLQTKTDGHFSELQENVKWGGAKGNMNDKSPPWVDELTMSEMKAVSQFVLDLRTKTEKAWQALDKYSADTPVSAETGRLVYQTRCAACHDESGRGDGPMSVIVKTPPPFDLVISQLPKSELEKITLFGGAVLGRSEQMPAWEKELSDAQIDSVVEYTLLLRK